MGERLDVILNEVEAISLPGNATIEGGIDARVMVGAYLLRCRELLQVVRQLGATGHQRVADPLVRAAIEFAATCGWLMVAPDPHFQLLLASSRRDFRLIKEQYEEGHGPIEIIHLGALEFMRSGPDDQRLPSLPDRAKVAGMYEWYTQYRMLSFTSHGTLLAPFTGAQVRHEDKMVDTYLFECAALTVAAMVLRVTRLASREFGWDREAAIDELVGRANQFLDGLEPRFPGAVRAG
jgi:hypothetical protein